MATLGFLVIFVPLERGGNTEQGPGLRGTPARAGARIPATTQGQEKETRENPNLQRSLNSNQPTSNIFLPS
jgi:hypothetical protein